MLLVYLAIVWASIVDVGESSKAGFVLPKRHDHCSLFSKEDFRSSAIGTIEYSSLPIGVLLFWDYNVDPTRNTLLRISAFSNTSSKSIAVMRIQIDDVKLLSLSVAGNVSLLSKTHAYATFTTAGALLLYSKDLTEGTHRIYFSLLPLDPSVKHAPSSFSILMEDIEVSGSGLRGFLFALLSCLLLATGAWFTALQLLKGPTKEPSRSQVSSPQLHRSSSRRGSNPLRGMPLSDFGEMSIGERLLIAIQDLFQTVWLYLSVVAVYFVPSYLVAIELYLRFRKGEQDVCAFNYQCIESFGTFPGANSLANNISQIVFGVAAAAIVLFEYLDGRQCPRCRLDGRLKCRHFEIYLLLTMSGISEGIMSALYHICPHLTAYEFDLAFVVNMSWIIVVLLHTKVSKGMYVD